MPREDLEITLSEADPYWSGALYFAVLAYPDPLERTQRDKFHKAIIRWTLQTRINMDKKWAQELQLIRPAYFSRPDSLHDSILKQGNKRLARRKLVAQYIVLPHLRKFDTGRTHKVEGLTPTVKNMLVLVTAELKIKGGSSDTIADREWRPLKPVAQCHPARESRGWTSSVAATGGRRRCSGRSQAWIHTSNQ